MKGIRVHTDAQVESSMKDSFSRDTCISSVRGRITTPRSRGLM